MHSEERDNLYHSQQVEAERMLSTLSSNQQHFHINTFPYSLSQLERTNYQTEGLSNVNKDSLAEQNLHSSTIDMKLKHFEQWRNLCEAQLKQLLLLMPSSNLR